MSDQAQAQVFQKHLYDDRNQKKDHVRRGPYTPPTITKKLQQLYDPNLPGVRHFYSQDDEGWFVGKVPTAVASTAGTPSYCTIAQVCVFNSAAQRNTLRPTGFIGSVWPPTHIDHLLGNTSVEKKCTFCEGRTCNCDYADWALSMDKVWSTIITIKHVGGRGYGVFSRIDMTGDEYADITLAELTGKLLLYEAGRTFTQGEDTYRFAIDIGGWSEEGQPQAWVDPMYTGNIARFINHSCNPNAKLQQARCGSRRILTVQKIGKVGLNEEITIDYGNGWFQPGEYCLCGSARCRNPAPKTAPKKGRAQR
jgi:hypothetical protein